MKFIKNFLIILLSAFLLIGCNNTKSKNETNTNNTSSKNNKYSSPFRGEEVKSNTVNNLPFMVMIENSSSARPQSGLSDADIVYETSAEGGIPRFIALFQQKYPNTIGPVRSVRPYFIDIAEMYNLPFVHCGGSEDSLKEISDSSSLMSINEISNGKYFWRSNERSAPHNLYTSSNNILNYLKDKNIKYEYRNPLTFNDDYFKSANLTEVKKIKITINKYYNTSYEYENYLFTKYMDNEKSIDANNNEPLSFNTIVIQKTNISLASDNSHLIIPLTGSGDGYVISQGKYTEVTWSKSENNASTILKDKNGNIVPLHSGKTIWHIVDNNTQISLS